jgi:molybdopterin converting factor small subunit
MRILLFAHLKDAAGQAELELNLSESVDADGLWRRLIAAWPALEPFRSSVRLARNCEFAGPATRFDNHDEAALIPPVSGG